MRISALAVSGRLHHVRVSGLMACFTRPEFRTERVSNVVGSASAWEGLLNCVNGHRGVRYRIESVALLFHPRRMTQTINEIKNFGNGRSAIDIEEDVRTLRTTSFIAGNMRRICCRNVYDDAPVERFTAGVDYILSFRLCTSRERYIKDHETLRRRLNNGHFWRQPCLGQRELPAMVLPVRDFSEIEYPDMPLVKHPNGLRTADHNEDLGLCFYGQDWDDPAAPSYFAPLKVRRGVVRYPSWEEVRETGIRKRIPQC